MKRRIVSLSLKMMIAGIGNHALMAAFLTIVTACAVISVQFTFGVLDANYEKEANRYGEQAYIFYNLDNRQANELRNMPSVALGYCHVYGCLSNEVVDQPIPYGYADSAYYEIGHIQIENGRMPESEDEIVVEETLGTELGVYQPGDVVYLSAEEGEALRFKVVGIIHDYVNLWNTAYYSREGKDVFLPRIITVKRNDNASIYAMHALIKPLGTYPMDAASQIRDELGVVDYAVNENMYYGDNSVESTFSKGLMLAFMVISLGASLVISISFSRLFTENNQNQFRIMRLIGMQRRDFILILSVQQGMMALTALVLGVLLGMLVIIVISASIGDFLLQSERIVLSILFAIVMIVAIIVVLIIRTAKIVFDTGTEMSVNRYRLISKKQSINIAVNASKANIMRSLPSILVLGLSMAACIAMTQLIAEMGGSHEIDYSIIAQSTREYKAVDGYLVLLNEGQGFPWASLGEVKDHESVEFVFAHVYDAGYVIESANIDDLYWGIFEESYYDKLKGDAVKKFEFVVVGDEQYASLCEGTDPTGDPSLPSCLLYTPETNGLKQTYYTQGDLLTVSGMQKTGYNEYEYVSTALQIQSVFDKAYVYEAGPMTRVYDVPVILITKDIAERMPLLRGYNTMDIILSKPIRGKKQIEKKLMEMVKQIPNATYSSTDEIQERMERLSRVISVLLIVLCVQVGGFSAISFCVMLWLNMRLNLWKYLVFRCLGMSEREVFKSIFMENGIYSICIYLIGCGGIFGFLVYMGWSMPYLASYIGKGCISLLGLATLTLMVSLLLHRSVIRNLKEPTFMNMH